MSEFIPIKSYNNEVEILLKRDVKINDVCKIALFFRESLRYFNKLVFYKVDVLQTCDNKAASMVIMFLNILMKFVVHFVGKNYENTKVEIVFDG